MKKNKERRDIQGKVVVKILRAKLNVNSNDPIVYVTLGNKQKKTKPQDEDNRSPAWNQTLELEKTEKDESALLFWILDEGFNNNIIGYTGLSIYSPIFSKLDEKYNLPLFNGDKNIGELVLHVSFKRK